MLARDLVVCVKTHQYLYRGAGIFRVVINLNVALYRSRAQKFLGNISADLSFERRGSLIQNRLCHSRFKLGISVLGIFCQVILAETL